MKSSKIARYSAICAIVFIGFALDTLLRNVFLFQIAVVSLIAVITVCLTCSLKESIVASLALGIFSMIRAIVMPSVVGALTLDTFWTSFANPLIAVLPRACIGLVVWTVNHALKRSLKKVYVGGFISSILGVVTNTGGVCLVMFVMKLLTAPGFDLWAFILGYFTINFVLELIISATVSPILAKGISKSRYFSDGGNG